MTSEGWRPMGQTAEEAEALHEGIPPWMARSVWNWIETRVEQTAAGTTYYQTHIIDAFDRKTRTLNPVSDMFIWRGTQALRDSWGEDTVVLFLDYLVAVGDREAGPHGKTHVLEELLRDGGSTWKVGTREDFPGLERRVPEGVQVAVDEATRAPGHAGPRLAEAWHAVYGVKPNPTHAYAMAVKAVEDATIPLVVPKQSGATLSHVIGQLRNDGDWGLPLTREHPDAPTAETVVRMLQGLWKGHHDRHGGDDTAPKSVGQEEAEAAVMLAVPLVQWFTSGAVVRR